MKCPFCFKDIKDGISQCPHCGREISLDSGQPAQTTQAPVKYAGFWIRFVANFIDSIIIGILSIIPTTIIALASGGTLNLEKRFEDTFDYVWIVVWAVYFVLLTYKKGATWGKSALGLKVISAQEENLSIGRVILREIAGKFLSELTLGIGYIMAGFSRKKQALHDRIARTYVIYRDPDNKSNTRIIVIVLSLFFIAFLGIILSIVLVSLNSARKKASDAAFKTEAQALVPVLIIACDREGKITLDDIGSPKYFDASAAFKTLSQDCNAKDGPHFSITVTGINPSNSVSPGNMLCTEKGCAEK